MRECLRTITPQCGKSNIDGDEVALLDRVIIEGFPIIIAFDYYRAAPVVDNTKLDWLNSVHARRLFKDTHQMNRFVNELRSELLSKELVFGLA